MEVSGDLLLPDCRFTLISKTLGLFSQFTSISSLLSINDGRVQFDDDGGGCERIVSSKQSGLR